jgi:enoyl-[acyl-carrier-protein] reductase (NADH)
MYDEGIAGMALYLASDGARGITGQVINVRCGQVMY